MRFVAVRSGRSLAEVVLVFWLFAFVLLAIGRVVHVHGRLATDQRERLRAAEAVRTAEVVLSGELRYLAPGDVSIAAAAPDAGSGGAAAVAGGSLALRAIRGGGRVCAESGEHVVVRYDGVRQPDPEKDSVLLVTERGEATHGIVSVGSHEACPGGVRLRVSPAPEHPRGLALVFESGAYHLSGGALRYERGASGRQPLTEAVFREPRLMADGPGRYRVTLPFHPDSVRLRAAGAPHLVLGRANIGQP